MRLGNCSLVAAFGLMVASCAAPAGPDPAPVATTVALAPLPPDPPPPEGTLETGLVWLEQPTAAEIASLYPSEAARLGAHGRVVMDCIVAEDGRLDCAVVWEFPAGFGFGEASLNVVRRFRIAPETADGTPTAGARVRRTIRWRTSQP